MNAERDSTPVHAAVLRVELRIPGARSMKDKRAGIRPIIDRLRHRLHVSVAEIGAQELRGRAVLGVALVASGAAELEALVAKTVRIVDGAGGVEAMEIEVSPFDGEGVLGGAP